MTRAELAQTEGRVKRIHVSQPHIRHNIKAAEDDRKPPLIVQTSKGPVYAWSVDIAGPSSLVWGEKPLSCGARVWIETRAALTLHDADRD